MTRLAAVAVLLATALSLSACGRSSSQSAQLPPSLRTYAQSILEDAPNGVATEVEVYGPGSRAHLVKADSGDWVLESASEKRTRFYLVVAHGHFTNYVFSPPVGFKQPPPATIATFIRSAQGKTTDSGFKNSIGPGVSGLNRLAVFTRPDLGEPN